MIRAAAHAPRLSGRQIFLLAGLTLLAGFLRCYRLSSQSLWIDEFLMIQRASLGDPFRWGDWFVNPQGPLAALVLRLWTAVAGHSEAALRFPSVVAGTLTVPLVFRLGRRLSAEAAWPAAILATISPFLVWYSQETRHYSLALLTAAWSAEAFLRFDDDRVSGRAVANYSASLFVGLMSHLTMAFVALAHLLTLVACRRRHLGRWLAAVVPAFVLFSPWLWAAVSGNINLSHLATTSPIPASQLLRGESTFSWYGIPYTAFVLLAGYSLGPSLAELHAAPRLSTVLPHLPVILTVAAGGLLAIAAGFGALRRQKFRLTFLILVAAVPLVLVVFLSIRNARVFNPRYMAAALPPYLALAGLGLSRLTRRAWVAGGMAWLLLVVPMGVSLGHYYFDGRYAREDVRGAARLLAREAAPGDIILGQGASQVLSWYYPGPATFQIVFGDWVADTPGLEQRVSRWTAGRRTAWLLITRPWLQDPQLRLKKLLDERFGPGRETRFDGALLVRYELDKAGG